MVSFFTRASAHARSIFFDLSTFRYRKTTPQTPLIHAIQNDSVCISVRGRVRGVIFHPRKCLTNRTRRPIVRKLCSKNRRTEASDGRAKLV